MNFTVRSHTVGNPPKLEKGYSHTYCKSCKVVSYTPPSLRSHKCPKCDRYYIPGSDGVVLPAKLNGKQISPLDTKDRYKAIEYFLAGTDRNTKLPQKYEYLKNLQVCNNSYLREVSITLVKVKNPKNIGVVSKRMDYQPTRMDPERGICRAYITLYIAAENPLPSADGMTNLWSRKLFTRKGNRVYKAKWLRSGRSMFDSYWIQEGWIAANSQGDFFHSSESAEAALSGLERKIKSSVITPNESKRRARQRQARQKIQRQARSRERSRSREELEKERKQLAANILSVIQLVPVSAKITRRDSLAAGNCEEGTDDFIQKYGYGLRQKVKIQDALKKEPDNPLLWKAALHRLRQIDKKTATKIAIALRPYYDRYVR